MHEIAHFRLVAFKTSLNDSVGRGSSPVIYFSVPRVARRRLYSNWHFCDLLFCQCHTASRSSWALLSCCYLGLKMSGRQKYKYKLISHKVLPFRFLFSCFSDLVSFLPLVTAQERYFSLPLYHFHFHIRLAPDFEQNFFLLLQSIKCPESSVWSLLSFTQLLQSQLVMFTVF